MWRVPCLVSALSDRRLNGSTKRTLSCCAQWTIPVRRSPNILTPLFLLVSPPYMIPIIINTFREFIGNLSRMPKKCIKTTTQTLVGAFIWLVFCRRQTFEFVDWSFKLFVIEPVLGSYSVRFLAVSAGADNWFANYSSCEILLDQWTGYVSKIGFHYFWLVVWMINFTVFTSLSSSR